MSKVKSVWLFWGVVLVAVGIGYGLLEFLTARSPLPVYGDKGHTVPAFVFTDQLDRTIRSEEIADKIWVANYFFCSCPTVCPKIMRNLQTIHEYLRKDDEVVFLSFTVDPKRDDVPALKRFADRYNASSDTWHFLTGDKKQLYLLARNGFLVTASEGGGGADDFIHSENVVLVDKQQQVRGIYNGLDAAAVNQLFDDLKKLKKAS